MSESSSSGGKRGGRGGRKGSAPALTQVSGVETGSSNNTSSLSTTSSSSSQLPLVQNIVTQKLKRLAAQQELQKSDLQSPGKSDYFLPAAAKRKRGGSFDRKAVMAGQMQPHETKKIGFIGAGNMARAIAEGWIGSGVVEMGTTQQSVYCTMTLCYLHKEIFLVGKFVTVMTTYQSYSILNC